MGLDLLDPFEEIPSDYGAADPTPLYETTLYSSEEEIDQELDATMTRRNAPIYSPETEEDTGSEGTCSQLTDENWRFGDFLFFSVLFGLCCACYAAFRGTIRIRSQI